jgi:hypothetical protein
MITLISSIEKNLSKTNEFIIKDGTTWGDTLRGSKNLVLLIERFSKSEFIPLFFNQIVPNSNSKSVSNWVITLERDAYYKFLIVAANDHNPINSYGNDKVVYGQTENHKGLFLSVDENVPVDTSLNDSYYWIPLTEISNFPFNTNSDSDYLCQDHVHDLASRVCIAEKALKYAGNDCDCPDKAIAEDYYWSLLYHHSMIYSVAFGEFKEAGRFLDQVVDRCTNGSAEDKDCGCHE